MAAKDALGRAGEEVAARYLQRHGYRILARNWRGSSGELDIVAEDDGTTVIVEVKTRAGMRRGHPFDAVTHRKLRTLRRLAGEWCAQGDAGSGGRIRIDVVGVLGALGGPARVEHLRGVS